MPRRHFSAPAALALLLLPAVARAQVPVAPGPIEVPARELVSTGPTDYTYAGAPQNTAAIQRAVNAAGPGGSVFLPPGHFVVATIDIQGKNGLTIRGAGRDRTTLRRAGFQWDNDLGGDAPQMTEVIHAERVDGLTIRDLTLDGNGHHMALKGRGTFGPDRRVASGTPQHPTTARGFQAAFRVTLAQNVVVENTAVRHGFRWAVSMEQVKGLDFRRNLIETGRLSSDYRGHWDGPPGSGVQHVHTSQDGIHLVNCVDSIVRHNTIRSEDSAVAIEANPAWDWWTFPGEAAPNTGCRGIKVHNNAMTTNSPPEGRGLLSDRDGIYGTGLSRRWIGQGGVDIFYNNTWDLDGRIRAEGPTSRIAGIEVYQNAVEGARYGVRAGFFAGADRRGSDIKEHRISGLKIFDHNAHFRAGVADERPAGIRGITRNDIPGTWNRTGGVGIAVRNADGLAVTGNEITDVRGGIGIEIVRVTQFRVVDNVVQGVVGTKLADEFRWDGGEGIRVQNDPNDVGDPFVQGGQYNAGAYEIARNRIGNVAGYGIFVSNTANGVVPRGSNSVAGHGGFDARERGGIFIRDSANVRQ